MDHNAIFERSSLTPEIGSIAVFTTLKHFVHKPLESCWGTMQAERHHRELEEAKRGPECSEGPGLPLQGDLPIALAEVQSGDVVGTPNPLQQIFNPGHWVGIKS